MLLAPTRVLFFTGKGGVGKTSVACATALSLAAEGERVLLISTDPASNLDEVLGVRLSTAHPTPIPGAPGLDALNLDPVAEAAAYRERVVGPYRGLLPSAAIQSMEEQLSGACTVEIAAFDAFSSLVSGGGPSAGYDRLIFDTAPTGHTLRLLSLPAAWSGFLDASTAGASCLGPLAGLSAQRALYAATRAALTDASTTTLVLVTRPERAAIREAERTRAELAEAGMTHLRLVVNGVFTARDPHDPLAAALEARGQQALAALEGTPGLAGLPRLTLPLLAAAPMGLQGLARLLEPEAGLPGLAASDAPAPDAPAAAVPATGAWTALDAWVEALAAAPSGVVMTMGKGGVGKTTLAAALAVALADRGRAVHLTTTDPAAHLSATLAGEVPGLTVSRIDPAAEVAAYQAEVLATAGAALDDAGRALLEEDLRSPCTEEIAVFRAFARTVAEGADRVVVLDTAPTGHTLLLLDASEAYHREVSRSASALPGPVSTLLPRLRDPAFTRVLLVALPEATPVHEAAALGADLARAGIRPAAWVVNASLTPRAVRDPVLVARRAHEGPLLEEVAARASASGASAVLVPWSAAPPVGPAALRALLAPGVV